MNSICLEWSDIHLNYEIIEVYLSVFVSFSNSKEGNCLIISSQLFKFKLQALIVSATSVI